MHPIVTISTMLYLDTLKKIMCMSVAETLILSTYTKIIIDENTQPQKENHLLKHEKDHC